ncbi:MAG: acyl--CoA ligase [Treponema sp.]|nr:acyl--CoA ligase [Treponema sp.]
MYEKQPWLKHFGAMPENINYPPLSLFAMFKGEAVKNPDLDGLIFFDKKTSKSLLLKQIEHMSRQFAVQGIKKNDKVIVCLPNIPQAVVSFYALNRLGAIPAPIHPLSAPAEIEGYAKLVRAKAAITLDGFFPRFAAAQEKAGFEKIIICSLKSEMRAVTKIGFQLTIGRKIKPVPYSSSVVKWTDIELKTGANPPELETPDPLSADEMALILFSGGSTGEPKAIMLSNKNCNALAMQMNAAGGPVMPGDRMLSILPIFHGFGLAVGIHAMQISPGTCILIPKFKANTLAALIKKYKPQFMAAVPSLYDALTVDKNFRKIKLDSFKGLFCGGDSLSPEIKKRFDEVLKNGGGRIMLREGYGLTETVTACAIMPRDEYRDNAFGVPCPDNWLKVVKPGTEEECAPLEDGEICINGPTVMLGYLNEPAVTADIIKKHKDGRFWVHSGDIGCMDEDGFFYFKQRAKRIIKTSGIAVYPSHIENILNKHPSVRLSCVIGIPHEGRGEDCKAFIQLKNGVEGTDELKQSIIDSCKNELMPYSRPRVIEFIERMPTTNVGKVAFRELEERERSKAKTSQ